MSKCPNSNAEPEQAVDGQYVYEAWIGCSDQYGASGIGFARSTNGGRTFGPSTLVPGSTPFGFFGQSWDPTVAVAPDGTVYVAYMVYSLATNAGGNFVLQMSPAVAVSFDHGQTFPQVSMLPVPPIRNPYGNWGDRPFITVGHDGTVYVTWDYGPRADEVGLLCPPSGSCAYSAGDFNAVIQKSTDGGQTWTMPHHISPGFPLGGAYSAPVVVEPNGTLGVLLLGPPNRPIHAYGRSRNRVLHEFEQRRDDLVHARCGRLGGRHDRAADLVDRRLTRRRPVRKPVRDLGHTDRFG